LVAMVAALALTLRKRKDVRAMDPGQQVRVKRADRVRMVSMPAEVEASAASAEPAEGGAAPGAQAPGAAPGSAGKGAA